MNSNKKSLRLIVLSALIALSLLVQACDFRRDVIRPWQEQKGIPTDCGVIC